MKIGDKVKVLPRTYLKEDFHGKEGLVTRTKDYLDHQGGYTMITVMMIDGERVLPKECFEVITLAEDLEKI